MYAEEEPQRAADSAFRAAEKKYKKCGTVEQALELGALDLHSYDNNDGKMQSESCSVFGRDCVKHSLGGYEGLHIITNALGDKQQVELAHHSLSESLAPPNRTNLHCHDIPEDIKSVLHSSIWRCDGPKLDTHGPELYERLTNTSSQQKVKFDTNTHSVNKKQKTGNSPSHIFRLPAGTTLSRVRWATLGYQYNWTERSYCAKQHVSFPSQLGQLAVRLAELCDESIVPEAGIVNFYPEGQMMGGHIDDGEEARENPVVSVSIGSPCVFLLGGYTKDEAPIAILLRSGDCLVLGGKARLRYHGVSKVFVATKGPPSYLAPSKATQYAEKGIHCAGCNCFLDLCEKKDSSTASDPCTCSKIDVTEVSRVLKVLACARINLNLRQVYRASLPKAC